MSKVFVEVPGKVWMAIAIGALLGVLSPNPLLTIASLLILPFLMFGLWRKGEPPVLSFLLFFQWLEATLKVFHADLAGLTVQDMFKVQLGEGQGFIFAYGKEIERALWLCLGGLAALAAGMRLGLAGIGVKPREKGAPAGIPFFSIRRLFFTYLVLLALSLSSTPIVWSIPGLTQSLLALWKLKWGVVFLMGYTVFQRKEKYFYLFLTFLLEVAAGFLFYYAEFRGIFLVLGVAFLTLHFRIRMKAVVTASMIFSLALFLAILWTGIKEEYRSFLTPEENPQAVAPFEARIKKLPELFRTVDLKRGAAYLAQRIAYVDFFAYVLERVPQTVPYEEGRLWKKAVIQIVRPRLLFPGKAYLESDSEITRKYAGLKVAGAEQKTSIGIGYFAESYVDFGPRLMFLPLFLMGLLQGLIYRYFISRDRIGLFRYALLTACLLFSGASVETNSTKLLGGLMTNFIVLALFAKFFGRRFLTWVSQKPFFNTHRS